MGEGFLEMCMGSKDRAQHLIGILVQYKKWMLDVLSEIIGL